ncbi:MAG: adaptor protein MecA [Clostridiales bacterium]|nr:adaptor protein MecA [Clostridiales bacterium]
MKLERLNDNQIRCTLSKSDLDKRELRLSELAYGSAKARALFRDMIQQASIELGFDADNIPLMIEAIPISNDCLVLVVTKVEDPDELDTRFSRFSSPVDLDELDDHLFPSDLFDDELALEDADFDDEILPFDDSADDEVLPFHSSSDDDDRNSARSAADEALDLIAPFTQAIAQAKKEVLRKRQEAANHKKNGLLMYTFSNLDTIIRLSSFLTPFYKGESLLYKDSSNSLYYLTLIQNDCDPDLFRRACTITSDYGTAVSSSYSTLPYFKEHLQCVFAENALGVLNQLNETR